MSRVARYDLAVVQGQDGDGVRFPVVDGDGAAIDPTTWTARAHVRFTPTGPLLGELTCTTSSDGVLVSWTAAQTSQWAFTSARYDVELTDPAGATVRLVQGTVTVDQEVTRG